MGEELNMAGKPRSQLEQYGRLTDLHGEEYIIPDYTIKDIYDAIPVECFKRNVIKSLSYVFQDLFLIGLNFYLFHTYLTADNVPYVLVRFALWSIYTVLQGIYMTGIWILAHECGHMAFSTSKIFNDTMGLIMHSSLLVPYFSWKITHRNHHKAVGNMFTDTSYVPPTRLAYATRWGKTVEEIAEYAEDTPIYNMLTLLFHQIFDWHIYMFAMVTFGDVWFEKKAFTRGDYDPKRNEDGTIVRTYQILDGHYSPVSPIFTRRDAKFIFITDIALLIVLGILTTVGIKYGWMNLLVWYGIPYLWVNHWVLTITYLHHTDGSLPHYNPKMWTFIRGAAGTIDRDVGFIEKYLFHHIVSTHVLHHHTSVIPHYNAVKASNAIKKVMGIHYKHDKTGTGMLNFLRNYWKNWMSCNWVEPSEGSIGDGQHVLFYRNNINVGVRPASMTKDDLKKDI